jgi:hypothetical protein
MLYRGKLENYDHFLKSYDRVSVVCMKTNNPHTYVIVQNDSKISLYQCIEKDDKFQPALIREFPEFKEITGTIHSGTGYEIDNHIFLFDEKNMYVIKTNPTPTCTVYEDVFCIGIQFFNKSYTYALC